MRGVVLDREGRVLGFMTGYYPESTHGSVIVAQAADIHAVLDAAKLPIESAPAVTPPPDATRAMVDATPTTAPTAAPPSTRPIVAKAPAASPAAASGDPAAKALRLARMYEAAEQDGPARAKLQQLISQYPNSPAANDAKGDLQRIHGK